jgi:hypothetical protein
MTKEGYDAKSELVRILDVYVKYYDEKYLEMLLAKWAEGVPTHDALDLFNSVLSLLTNKYPELGESEEAMIETALREKLKMSKLIKKLPELKGIF